MTTPRHGSVTSSGLPLAIVERGDAGLALADRDHVVRYDVHYTSIPGPCLEA